MLDDDEEELEPEPELTLRGTPKRKTYAQASRRKWKTPEQVMHDERKRIFIGQILHMAGRRKKDEEGDKIAP